MLVGASALPPEASAELLSLADPTASGLVLNLTPTAIFDRTRISSPLACIGTTGLMGDRAVQHIGRTPPGTGDVLGYGHFRPFRTLAHDWAWMREPRKASTRLMSNHRPAVLTDKRGQHLFTRAAFTS